MGKMTKIVKSEFNKLKKRMRVLVGDRLYYESKTSAAGREDFWENDARLKFVSSTVKNSI